MKRDMIVHIDEPVVIVTRIWFDEAVSVLQGELGCPFCGSKREMAKDSSIERYGCLDCNRWLPPLPRGRQ